MDVRGLLQKSEWNEIDYINFILEACVSSCRFGLIKEIEGDTFHLTRGNIHCLLSLPFGSGKTSSLVKIENGEIATDLSFPGIVGTINREGQFIEGAVVRSAGKVLIIDEAERLSRDVKLALMSILEYPNVYKRVLGFRLTSNFKKKTKFCSVIAKQNTNEFYIRSRFSCIASGMFINRSGLVDSAWFSRFIVVRFKPTLDYYYDISAGKKSIKVNPKIKEMDFIFEDYLKFHNYFWDKLRKSVHNNYFERNPDIRGLTVRVLQDLVRLSAFVESLDDRSTISFDTAKFIADRFMDYMIYNFTTHNLDEIDHFILNNLGTMSITQIAEYLGKDKSLIEFRISKLTAKGLIKSV
ncbi:MAG: hypothetical protein QXL14_02145 [Candidatus Aenigmatarchaeota archaeon]